MAKFWDHASSYFEPRHPACDERSHIPIGLSGDDAKYTLAGSKVVVCLLSYVLQKVERFFPSFTFSRLDINTYIYIYV